MREARLFATHARLYTYIIAALVFIAAFVACVSLGSVTIPFGSVALIIWDAILDTLAGRNVVNNAARSIIINVRLPRVLCVTLSGMALSLSGASIQGLLRNPLADGSTLGVSSGASLGAVVSIALGSSVAWLPAFSQVPMAIAFAFLSLLFVLSLAYKLDRSLETSTILLIGVIFSMCATSVVSLITVFAGDRVKTIVFWTMGSFAGSSYIHAAMLLAALTTCGGVLVSLTDELNALAISEENAASVGVSVRRVKIIIMVAVSTMIGVVVSIGGAIGFVGLVVPHMARLVTGANHRRLMPAATYIGGVFLMLVDLLARVVMRPLELPIGVITSIIGSALFVALFCQVRRKQC